ncbi:hypothetical protein PAHAL_7G005100 [Panicum hallii]|uniref:Glabrous enhancer-binding protein-like DBD domain-containing protein n=1 Tax=Panicum hallii TaxID=206008 RepID=A0A2S3I4Y2_9POAL|nr:hypothetical protein PAHAL_7G005100 [Panicum hallii]
MAPTIPPSFPASRRGKSAAAPTITISSGSDVSVRRTPVINVSSSSSDDEVTSRPRSAARRATPPSSVSVVRSPRASSNRGGGGKGDEATSQPRRAARRPSSPASPAVSDRSSDSGGSRSEATSSQPKKKNKWCLDDERLILDTMAFLRMGKGSYNKVPKAPEVLRHLVTLRRRGVDVRQLSDKISQLKVKFKKTVAKAAANGGKLRRRTRHRHKVLYEISQQVWPHLYQDAGL